jgi:hypothetical protein
MQDLDTMDCWTAKDWQYYRLRRTSLPDVPGILLYREVLYLVKSGGIVQTLHLDTGKLPKQGRLTNGLDE